LKLAIRSEEGGLNVADLILILVDPDIGREAWMLSYILRVRYHHDLLAIRGKLHQGPDDILPELGAERTEPLVYNQALRW